MIYTLQGLDLFIDNSQSVVTIFSFRLDGIGAYPVGGLLGVCGVHDSLHVGGRGIPNRKCHLQNWRGIVLFKLFYYIPCIGAEDGE